MACYTYKNNKYQSREELESYLIEEQIQFQKALNRVGVNLITNGFVYNEALDPRNILNEMINKGLIEKIC